MTALNMINSFIQWSRVLLEKLIVPHLAKIFLVFQGTRMFISAYMRARHLSISWTSLKHEVSEVQNIAILRDMFLNLKICSSQNDDHKNYCRLLCNVITLSLIFHYINITEFGVKQPKVNPSLQHGCLCVSEQSCQFLSCVLCTRVSANGFFLYLKYLEISILSPSLNSWS